MLPSSELSLWLALKTEGVSLGSGILAIHLCVHTCLSMAAQLSTLVSWRSLCSGDCVLCDGPLLGGPVILLRAQASCWLRFPQHGLETCSSSLKVQTMALSFLPRPSPLSLMLTLVVRPSLGSISHEGFAALFVCSATTWSKQERPALSPRSKQNPDYISNFCKTCSFFVFCKVLVSKYSIHVS